MLLRLVGLDVTTIKLLRLVGLVVIIIYLPKTTEEKAATALKGPESLSDSV